MKSTGKFPGAFLLNNAIFSNNPELFAVPLQEQIVGFTIPLQSQYLETVRLKKHLNSLSIIHCTSAQAA